MTLLSYTRVGQGFPLVLQHGYFGGAEMWQAQIDHFKSRYDVIAPNLAGFGDSSELVAPDSIAESAQQVFDLLDLLGVDQFYLLGHSMGGMVVQQMATMQAALASLTAWERWDGSSALATISCPTLVLWGDHDRSYGWRQPESLWQGITDSYLAVMPGCAHNAPV